MSKVMVAEIEEPALEIMPSPKPLGQYPLAPETIITFPRGLPAFENIRHYTFRCLDTLRPFMFMEAVEDVNVCFVCIDAFAVCADYRLRLSATVKNRLKVSNAAELAILCIVTVGDSVDATTANLLCPLVINRGNMQGEQVIMEGSGYPVRAPLLTRLCA